MKPPHWLCLNCGLIMVDSGKEPAYCIRCDGTDWVYLGYEGEYDIKDYDSQVEEFQINKKLENLTK